MNRRQYAIAVSFSISLLTVALIPLSGQRGSSYNPWLDNNDDGIIDVEDLHVLGSAYGTSGTPLNLPMALEYDSGWIDIHDKQGQYFDIAPGFNLETSTWMPRIYGRTVTGGALHQRHFDGTGTTPGWNETYGGASNDFARSVIQTSDGGYALAGNTTSFGAGASDFYLVKTDATGTMQWNRTYGGSNADGANSVVQTSDEGYAIAGYTKSFGAGGQDFYLVKTDSDGTMEWSKTYGGTGDDIAFSLIRTNLGGYALAGSTDSSGAGLLDFWLVITDAGGIMLWNETYGRPDNDRAESVVKTSDGGYALGGYSNSSASGDYSYDFWLIKTDASGHEQWNETYGGGSNDYCHSMIQTSDGGYALAGYAELADAYYPNFWLFKTDSAGNYLWSRTYGGQYTDCACSVIQTNDGGYALAGYCTPFDWGGAWAYACGLIKTDSAGIFQWVQTYEVNGHTSVSMIQTSDGGYVLSCSYFHTESDFTYDFWLAKTDAFGLVDCDQVGLTIVGYTTYTLTLYRGKMDPYWNYVRIRIWVVKEAP